MCDVGDIFCPANIHLGPRPDLGYPCACGVGLCMGGKVGIIHLDRHVDTQEKDMDEIMHTCPWFPATNMPKPSRPTWCSWGSGGWQVPRSGVKVGRERGTTCLTVSEIEKIGVDKTIEIGLQMAFVEGGPPNAVIDVIDLTVRPKIGRFPLPFNPKK